MSEPARGRMTSDEFIVRAMKQPESEHYELTDGEVVSIALERVEYALAKQHIWCRYPEAIEAGNLPCEAFVEGPSVTVDETTTYEPDVLVRCGAPLPAGTVKLADAMIIVEMQSPSTVRVENRTIVHRERGENGIILTRIVREGPIVMDPPGITLSDCFPPGVA